MKQNVFQSTIFRIVAITIALVLPINIMTLVLSNLVLEKNREQLSNEIHATLQVNADRFSDVMTRASRKLTYLSIKEPDYIALANADAGDAQRGAYLSSVKQKLEAVQMDFPWVDLLFFQFPKVDFTIISGFPGFSYQTSRDYIWQAAGVESNREIKWTTDAIDGVSVLFGAQAWNNTNYGAIVNLDRLIDKLDLPAMEGRTVFFADADGEALTGAGAQYMQENALELKALTGTGRYRAFSVPIPHSNLELVAVVDWSIQERNLPMAITALQVVAVLMTLIVIPLLLILMRRWVIRPLGRLTKAIRKIEQGDLDYRIEEAREGREFDQINRSFNHMMEQVKALKIDVYDKELEKKNIQMRYLSQQIQPHFILNAMNIIYSYDPHEYPLIQQMVLCITKYFRYIVKVNADFVTLSQELEHIENYFMIQEARYPGLFSSSIEYDGQTADALIPPLLIQNFAENAIKHSLQIGNRIAIRITATCYRRGGNARMRIRLADTGVGISDELLHKIEVFKATGRPQQGLGLGIQNSIERMQHLYGGETDITFGRGEGQVGTVVEIDLPVYHANAEGEGSGDEDTAGG